MKFAVGMSFCGYTHKPQGKEIAEISREAVQNVRELELEELACLIGREGYSFLPAFMRGERKQQNFRSMQWFVLDFDGGVSFQEIHRRSAENNLHIAFAYHTFRSSEKEERFRTVYIHEVPVADRQVAEMMLDMLLRVFPEADRSCRDVSRMFFGGKGMIFINPDARFSLVDLRNAFVRVSDKGDNLQRNIRAFAKKHGIQVTNGHLAVGHLSEMSLFDGKWLSANIIYIGENQNPSFFAVRYDHHHPVKTCLPKKRQTDIRKTGECMLLCDFMKGQELGHDAKFALALNLRYIHGGRKFFLEIIRNTDGQEKYRKWEQDFRYMKGYYPKKCSPDFCRYYEKCSHEDTVLETLLLDKKIKRTGEERLYSLEEAYGMLWENLNRAYDSGGEGMHLIRAQTAMGKTRAYVKLTCEKKDAHFIIACPTNRLKLEVAHALKSEGEICFVTPSVQQNPMVPEETADLISSYHEAGLHNMGRKILREFMEEIPDICIAQKEEVQRIIDGLDGMKEERIIVTTHAFLLQMPEDFLRRHTVIIDEDILQLQIFTKICGVSAETLEQAVQCSSREIADIAERILGTPAGEYRKIKVQTYGRKLSEQELEDMGAAGADNLNDLLAAGSYIRKEDGDVMYFCPQKLPRQKYILLSATLNEEIYRAYFGGDMPVTAYPEKKAAYRGRLKQYTCHLLSRKDLAKKMEVFETAKKFLQQKEPQIITFMKFGKQNDAGIHFGNSSGTNALEGKDIAIIGTPYKNEESYKLTACYLGADVNREQDKYQRRSRVQYKGYDFFMTAFSGGMLRTIQMYSMESELEQCIGRARLLRRDCTVYLFSAFPCEQAEISVKDYLNQNMGHDSD